MHSSHSFYEHQAKESKDLPRLPSISTLLQYIGIEPHSARESSYYVNNTDDSIHVDNKSRMSQTYEEQPLKKTRYDQHIHRPSHSEGCIHPNIHNLLPEDLLPSPDTDFDEGTERSFVCEHPNCQRTFARRSDL